MTHETGYQKHIYWVPADSFDAFKSELEVSGHKVYPAGKTSCGTLNAHGKTLRYATPEIFSGLCGRQGAWYRASDKVGSYLVVSEPKLADNYDTFLDAIMEGSEFRPADLPSNEEIGELVDSEAYRNQRPDDWEKVTFVQKLMYKALFSATRAWGFGDNMKKHWPNHKANHANFLTGAHTTEIDGEDVPYSVTNNDGVCSSCVEFFNVINPGARKLVRACPGAVLFSTVENEKYYDVRPVVPAN